LQLDYGTHSAPEPVKALPQSPLRIASQIGYYDLHDDVMMTGARESLSFAGGGGGGRGGGRRARVRVECSIMKIK
jgi:hypothetical protein